MIEVATFKVASTLPPEVTIPGWLGYPILNNEILWVRFEGNSQEEVIKKANAWYDNEVDRQKQIGMIDVDGRSVPSGPYKKSFPDSPKGLVATEGWGEPSKSMAIDPPASGFINSGWDTPQKEHGLAGSVWLIHHGLRIKGRFPASKVDAMIAEGYERGGPRTQFKGDGGW